MTTRERAFNAKTLPALIMQILSCNYKVRSVMLVTVAPAAGRWEAVGQTRGERIEGSFESCSVGLCVCVCVYALSQEGASAFTGSTPKHSPLQL
jgi:hypothetical protein